MLKDELQEDRLEQRVELFVDVLDEERLTELEAVLEHAHEVLVGLLDRLERVLGLLALDPLVGLALRVDHERPARGVEGDNGVLDREDVRRQAAHLPVAHLDRVAQRGRERERLGHRYELLATQLRPVFDRLLD